MKLRMPRLLLLAVVLLALPLAGATASPQPPSQGQSASVAMGSNWYDPREVRIDVGGTVEWEAVAGGHDVRADDGSFFLWPDRKSESGETRSHTFEEEGVHRYYCTLHGGRGGNGMAGIVYVGDAELETVSEIEVPSEEHPTLRAALRDARRGTTIRLEPGVHRAGNRVQQPGVTIEGTGEQPGDVLIQAAAGVGLRVEESGATLRNLRVASGSQAGIQALGVDRLRLEDVEVAAGDIGVDFAGGRGLTIHGGSVEGHDRAGVRITDCDPCDARIESLRAQGNLVGIDLVDAAGAVINGNDLRDNAGGIRAAATPDDPVASPRTVVISDNRLTDNAAPAEAGPDAQAAIPSGAAIWLAGARQAEVWGNRVDGGHTYGVAVTALGGASADVEVRDNVVTDASEADLAWDGLGANVCFSGNTTPDDAEPTSQPPEAQTVYDCDAPATVGVPNPQPLLGLSGHAFSSQGEDEDGSDEAAAAAGGDATVLRLLREPWTEGLR
jgi:plastocyanin